MDAKSSNKTNTNLIEVFKNMTSMTSDFYMIMNSEGIIIEVFGAFESILSYQKSDLVAQSIKSIVEEDDAEAIDLLFRKNRLEQWSATRSIQFKHNSTKEKQFILNLNWDPSQQLFYGLVKSDIFTREIQDQYNSLQQQNAELLNITEAFIWSIDQNYNIQLINLSFQKHIKDRFDINLKIGDNFFDAFNGLNPEYFSKWKNFYDYAFQGNTVRSEIGPADDHIELWLDVEIKPIIENNSIVRLLCHCTRITKRKLAEDRLKEYSAKLKDQKKFADSIINNVPLGIAVNEISTGKALYMNEIFAKIYGYPADELEDVETFLLKIYPDKKYREEISNRILTDIQSGDPKRMAWSEIKITRKNGSTAYVNAKNIPVPDQDLMISTVFDVTELVNHKRQLSSLLEEKDLILSSISDAFIALNSSNKISYLNEEAEKLMNTNLAQALDQDFIETPFMKGENLLLNAIEEVRKEHKSKKIEFYADFPATWFKVKLYPGAQGSVTLYFQNITIEKQAEKEIRTLNNVLEIRARNLEAINKELEQFVFIASHDLQEPVRSITSFMDRLKASYGPQLDEKANQYIDFALRGGRRMQQLIIDLLSYSRIEKEHTTKFERFESTLIIQEVINDLNIEDNKQVEISYFDLPLIFFNKSRFYQLVRNLLENAIKYSSKRPKIYIKIYTINHPDEYEFIISDNGIGIEKQYFERIFYIFKRLHTQKDYSGTGIGLAICRKITDSVNGKIWVTSDGKSGSDFHFTLPKDKI